MQDFTIGDLGVFIGTIGGVVTGILIVLQKSKCKNIKCCGTQCDRDPEARIEMPVQADAGAGDQANNP